ncbi:exported protein of unknown function [uncultured Sphingopyxis sp.]|uniref:Uncharacterized protein n=1 Tax=uncultured Sphingopyxis sp. TaxID=310581 RepID=A0A1Y5Q1L6_9SPHN|nr:exported protein of unknown function [uncultured Sphingopyxis sp.]
MAAPADGASLAACSASALGFAGSVTVRQTRFGTVLPVTSIFSQIFLVFTGFAGAASVALVEVAAKARESNAEIIRLFALPKGAGLLGA